MISGLDELSAVGSLDGHPSKPTQKRVQASFFGQVTAFWTQVALTLLKPEVPAGL